MSEQNKAIARRFYDEVVSQDKLDLIDELVDPNVVEHEEFPGLSPGREGVKEFFAMFRSAFPDLQFTIEDMVAEGDKVAARVTVRGTHKGPFLDIATPTGKQITVGVIDIFRFASGKIVDHWGVTDQMSMMQQLGAIPQ
jgi:steroid delta-isomerase-like uncharacterized protein